MQLNKKKDLVLIFANETDHPRKTFFYFYLNEQLYEYINKLVNKNHETQ